MRKKVQANKNKKYQKNDQLLSIMYFQMIMNIFQKNFFFVKFDYFKIKYFPMLKYLKYPVTYNKYQSDMAICFFETNFQSWNFFYLQAIKIKYLKNSCAFFLK